ncbi:hypothetical protein F5I97DRAFT_1352376 [Phlebopus sp. FC_14]|nr:hypothetical protein F5I97DRAFT_1352376 [Phlebopus sp. FC_14]
MSSTTVYRRQSMAQLYEKLRAQDDGDDMAWLAQFSPEEKLDEPYVPAAASPSILSPISSASASTSSPSTAYSEVNHYRSDSDPSDNDSSSDSESNLDPVPLSLHLSYPEFQPASSHPSLIFQSNDFSQTQHVDLPYDPPLEHDLPRQPRSTPNPADSGHVRIVAPTSPSTNAGSSLSIVAPLPIRRRRATRSCRPIKRSSDTAQNDSDDDAYIESDGDASEDEYIPSPFLNPRKRHRSSRVMHTNPSADVASNHRVASNSYRSAKRPRQSPLPRNVQATPDAVPASSTKSNPWACPYCKWVQRNHRSPDLKRHIETHTRLQRPAQWVCCGIPLKDAKRYNLPKGAEPYAWDGQMMIGGCGKEFSRRDALKRHLDNEHITCVGNFNASANTRDDEQLS